MVNTGLIETSVAKFSLSFLCHVTLFQVGEAEAGVALGRVRTGYREAFQKLTVIKKKFVLEALLYSVPTCLFKWHLPKIGPECMSII